MNTHDDDTCPHLVMLGRLEAENARLKAEVHRLEEIVGSDAIDRKYGMCCDASDEVVRLKAEVERSRDQYNGIIDTQLAVIDSLKAEVERLTLENNQYEEHHKYGQNVITSLREEVERLTKENETITKDKALLWASHKIALQDIQGLHYALQTAKEGKQP